MYLKIISELGNIDDLPTIPPILVKLNEILADPESSAEDVASLIKEDQVLTTRLLKLVNSAYYGFTRKITTVTHAVVILGFRNVKNIVLTAKTFDLYKSSYTKIRRIFDVNLLWQHSLGVAVIAKKIGELVRYPDQETLFTGGLIHDIGKIVEIKCLFDYMPRIFELVRDQNISMWQAEQSVFNITHAEIGKVLGDMWDFPLILEHIVAYHHYPHLSEDFSQQVAIVHIANSLCREMKIGSGGDSLIPVIEDGAWERAGLEPSVKEYIIKESQKSISELLPVFA
ncbi:MAG: HDOD domain-containing protein [Candidatus Auribacterota bacterium]|jgi:putative nucleotidyltransferase with HDIG domain|nr:HDOD domain-containing protein [Candidatus Auribacterota bacterium]